jgi:hypothetical protein
MVVAGEFTEIQARLVLGGHHHPVPLGYILHEGPHLRRPVHQGLGLLVGETLLQHPADQVLSISQQAEINIQALPSYIHPALIEEFRLVLAAGSGADQPEGHFSSPPHTAIPFASSYSRAKLIPAYYPGSSSCTPT